MGETIVKCLLCGRSFRSLGSHLRRAHGIGGAEYRQAFDLPVSHKLAADDLRDAQRNMIRLLQANGTLNYDHLPEATEAARGAGRGYKCRADRERQREIARKTGSANINHGADELNKRGRKYRVERETLQRWRKQRTSDR